jgi:hypothetical protein
MGCRPEGCLQRVDILPTHAIFCDDFAAGNEQYAQHPAIISDRDRGAGRHLVRAKREKENAALLEQLARPLAIPLGQNRQPLLVTLSKRTDDFLAAKIANVILDGFRGDSTAIREAAREQSA